jgi:hypothetical protein
MQVMKINRNGLWGAQHIDFYIADEQFDRVAKVTFTGHDKPPYLTVVKPRTVKGLKLKESSLLELLVVTGLDGSHIRNVIARTPR